MKRNYSFILKYIQVHLYALKVVTYSAMAIITYSQIQMKGLNAPNDILELIEGPLGRVLIAAAVFEAIHNLIGLAERLHSKNS